MRPRKPKRLPQKDKRPAASEKISFTELGLKNAEPRNADYTINDPKTTGLLLKVTPAGRKVFVFRYRTVFGRQRKLSIGKLGEVSVSTARRKAKELAVEVRNGADPASERINQRKAMTVAEFAAVYLRDQAKPKLAPSTYKEYERVLQSRVLPKIGKLALVELSRSDIEALHASMSSTPIRANRMLSVVKAMLFKAEDWDAIPRGSNPASRVKMNKERPKQHYFSDAEQARIFRAINLARGQMPNSKAAFDAITLLFFTGCRPSEVLRLCWEDIDLVSGVATLHNTKTGEGRLLLANAAVNFLQSIAQRELNEGWVFPGAKPGERLKTLTKPWKRVCDLAGLPDACLKDIRHTVGTYVARTGGLHSAQAILRHTSPVTTRRYAHPFEAAVRGDLENAMMHI